MEANGGNKLARLDDLGFSDLKKQILLSAGLTPEVMGALLQQSIGALEEGLSATKTQYFSKDGIVTDERTDVDHSTRIKSASEMAHLVSSLGELKASDAVPGAGASGVSITLNVPFLEQLRDTSIDVTSNTAAPPQ